jgi:hypothetical protein
MFYSLISQIQYVGREGTIVKVEINRLSASSIAMRIVAIKIDNSIPFVKIISLIFSTHGKDRVQKIK